MEHQHTPEKPVPSTDGAGAFLKDTAPSSKEFAEAVAKGYEPHDIGLRGIIVFIGGLVVTMVVVLAFIYAVMMALAEYDRSHDAIASPVAVKLPPVYAPLQPSLGFNGDHDNDHDLLDAEDMLLMRKETADVLDSQGTTATGRRYIAIDSAIDKVAPDLEKITKPELAPVVSPTYPEGAFEGKWPGMPEEKPTEGPKPKVNELKILNDYRYED